MDSIVLYHYTSLDVLKCIFEEYSIKNPFLTFWATNCAYMNDPKEISEGVDLIRDAMFDISCPILKERARVIWENDKIKDALLIGSAIADMGVPYAMSLSKNEDNINMWRMYGQSGHGIAIGFKQDKLIVEGYELAECYYNDHSENIINTFTKCFEYWFTNLGNAPSGVSQRDYDFIRTCDVIGRTSALVKNEAYHYEKEKRLITFCKTPKFRVVNGILVPYTILRLPIESLESVIVGPDCDERNINSLRIFFLSKGLRDISENIKVSEVPYRN